MRLQSKPRIREPGLPNRLRRRAPWLCYRANQLQRSRDAAILRIMSLVCATERTSYRGADIVGIDKKDININIFNININNINSNINNINININMNNINININMQL